MSANSRLTRSFYPNAAQGEDPANVRHIIKADPVITNKGVLIEFEIKERHMTPDELRALARWFFSLSAQTVDVARAGLITETASYNVVDGKVVHVKADTT